MIVFSASLLCKKDIKIETMEKRWGTWRQRENHGEAWEKMAGFKL